MINEIETLSTLERGDSDSLNSNLHFGLKTRPRACKTVMFSSVPNDLNFDFLAVLPFLERFAADGVSLSSFVGIFMESKTKGRICEFLQILIFMIKNSLFCDAKCRLITALRISPCDERTILSIVSLLGSV